MSDQIQRLREVAEAATEGPWEVCDGVGYEHDLTMTVCAAEHVAIASLADDWWQPGDSEPPACTADAEHIATFDPPTVLELLDRLERAEAAVERVRNSVGAVMAVRASGRYDDPTTLGWLDAFVGDITDALDGGER